jgi:hypothetical protein
MKALSLKQPFAELIKNGTKTIETRLWSTKYRGNLLICASLSNHNGFVKSYNNFIKCSDLLKYYNDNGIKIEHGYAICIVNLYDVRPMIKEDETAACCELYDGAYSWLINNVRIIEPFYVKGQLKLFDVDDNQIKILKV